MNISTEKPAILPRETIELPSRADISTVVFDMDGTLLDTLTDTVVAINHTMGTYGFPRLDTDYVRSVLGNGVVNLLGACVPDGQENPAFEAALTTYKAFYSQHAADKTAPYPGCSELIDDLLSRSYKIAIVSNKFDAVMQELNSTYFNGRFPVALGENEAAGVSRKPNPDMVFKALELLGVDKEHALYVGDSEVDLATAHNAGLPCLSCTWGFREERFLIEHGATQIIREPHEVIEWLEGRTLAR